MSIEDFEKLVSRPEPEIELDRAALAVSREYNPDVDPGKWLLELDRLAEGVHDVGDLRLRLFAEERFIGDARTYHEPVNSFLDRVIARRRGIPITLSILTMEIGRRAGVRLQGVNMPGHFVVRDPAEGLYLDPFVGGLLLDEIALEERFHEVNGPSEPFGPDQRQIASSPDILGRLLANLAGAYTRRWDPPKLELALRLRLAIPEVPRQEVLQLARALAAQGRFTEAVRELDEMGRKEPALAGLLLPAARALAARMN